MNKTFAHRHMQSIAAFVFLVTPLIGCGGPQLARYDATTYQNLTFEKPEVLAVYDTFKSDPINESQINAINLKLSQIHEYEAGKGSGNVDMTSQVESIQNMFKKHVTERRRDGVWNDTNLANHKDAISEAFDKAIKTEQAKNK